MQYNYEKSERKYPGKTIIEKSHGTITAFIIAKNDNINLYKMIAKNDNIDLYKMICYVLYIYKTAKIFGN